MRKWIVALSVGLLVFSPGLFGQAPTNITKINGLAPVAAICDDHAQVLDVAINLSSATTAEIVALSSSQVIYVCGYDFVASGTVTVTFKYGTGSNCGTGTTSKTGPYPMVAQFGLVRDVTGFVQWKVPVSNALCVTLSGAVQVSGILTYVKRVPPA